MALFMVPEVEAVPESMRQVAARLFFGRVATDIKVL
jgi:hypothetical protein